jgi:putative oxidoreductase
MPEFSGLFTAEPPKTTWVDRLKTTVPPALVGLLFVFIGYTKFNGDPRGEWYQTFERIGLGQWFRIFTGVVQVAGGLMMCVPKTMIYGAALLTCTMLGAVFVDIFVIHMPFFIVPFFLGVVIVTVAMLCRP